MQPVEGDTRGMYELGGGARKGRQSRRVKRERRAARIDEDSETALNELATSRRARHADKMVRFFFLTEKGKAADGAARCSAQRMRRRCGSWLELLSEVNVCSITFCISSSSRRHIIRSDLEAADGDWQKARDLVYLSDLYTL